MAAIHVAVAAAQARTKVLDAFRVHGATAPERAATLDDLHIGRDDIALAQLVKVGVIRSDHRQRVRRAGKH